MLPPTENRLKCAAALKKLVSKRPLSDVSTSEIAAEAGISRQAFYKSFQDKYELAFWIFYQEQHPVVQNNCFGLLSFHDQNLQILNIFLSDKIYYINLFRDHEQQNSFFQQFISHCIETMHHAFGKDAYVPDIRDLFKLYVNGTLHTILDWVLGGMQESPEYLVNLFDEAMPEKLKKYLLP